MKEYNYSYTDKVLNAMSKKFITLFNRVKNLANFDELNVIKISSDLYLQLYQIVKDNFLLIGKSAAKQVGGDEGDITTDWLLDFFEEYDPITEYVFDHEVERKKARFQESLIATQDHNAPVKRALGLWDRMVRQYGIEITDRVAIEQYKVKGIKEVQWITNIDGKECEVCKERHLKVYPIDKVPTKAHIGCRCRLKPYE